MTKTDIGHPLIEFNQERITGRARVRQVVLLGAGLAAPGSWSGCDIINSMMLTSPLTRQWVDMQADAGAPWIGVMDDPVEFLAVSGYPDYKARYAAQLVCDGPEGDNVMTTKHSEISRKDWGVDKTSLVYICFGLIGLGLVAAVVWRLASRRHTLPCPTWLRWLVELDNPFTKINRAQVIIEHINLQPGMKVLDVGCGPGRLTIPMAQQIGPQGEVVAIDIQAGMLQRAQEKARTARLSNIRFRQVGVGEGKLERNQYDRALLVTVLGEIPDRKGALKEIFEALKPGGILSVTELIFDPHFQRRRTVRQLAAAVGFKEQDCFGSRFSYTMNLEKPSDT